MQDIQGSTNQWWYSWCSSRQQSCPSWEAPRPCHLPHWYTANTTNVQSMSQLTLYTLFSVSFESNVSDIRQNKVSFEALTKKKPKKAITHKQTVSTWQRNCSRCFCALLPGFLQAFKGIIHQLFTNVQDRSSPNSETKFNGLLTYSNSPHVMHAFYFTGQTSQHYFMIIIYI